MWIAFTANGFELRQAEDLVGGVKWNDVCKVVAFKRDMLTWDLICLAFYCVGNGKPFQVNDDAGGFWELVDRVKDVFPDSEQDWEESVVKPAFARNERVIFERPPST